MREWPPFSVQECEKIVNYHQKSVNFYDKPLTDRARWNMLVMYCNTFNKMTKLLTYIGGGVSK